MKILFTAPDQSIDNCPVVSGDCALKALISVIDRLAAAGSGEKAVCVQGKDYSYILAELLVRADAKKIYDDLTVYIDYKGTVKHAVTPWDAVVASFGGSDRDEVVDKFFNYMNSGNPNEFRDCLTKYMALRGITDNPGIYKLAGVSKSTFSKLMNYKQNHKPKKATLGALAIGLKLNLEQAQELYHSAGFHLSDGEFVDRVVKFFISERIYDINEVNYYLYEFGYPILGERPREQ